jgi:hypothetical protein
MMRQVADGVLIHQSELLQNNAVVVQGRAGVLLIDPGITGGEMACLANDLRESGQPVAAGFSTHPDWDHVLWHAELGEAPRYGTAQCAAAMRDLLSDADWKTRVAEALPPEIAEDVPLDLFGLISGLPADTMQVPWEGPPVRILEHRADDVDVLIPGHGSVGGADEVRARIERDRAYVDALRVGRAPDDPRIGPSAAFGKDWLPGVYEWQRQQLAGRGRDATPA